MENPDKLPAMMQRGGREARSDCGSYSMAYFLNIIKW